LLVTVPIGAWVASVVFDVASHVVHHPAALVTGARWLIAIGVVGAVAAASVGFLDYLLIPAHTPAHRTAVTHMVLNLAITAVFTLNFAWRAGDSARTPAGPLTLSLLSLVALAASGALGGKLAYHYGVRVADETTQAEGFHTMSLQSRPVDGPSAAPVTKEH
jgi:uncharacterized membrane protein